LKQVFIGHVVIRRLERCVGSACAVQRRGKFNTGATIFLSDALGTLDCLLEEGGIVETFFKLLFEPSVRVVADFSLDLVIAVPFEKRLCRGRGCSASGL
jgi:hypothetical protein